MAWAKARRWLTPVGMLWGQQVGASVQPQFGSDLSPVLFIGAPGHTYSHERWHMGIMLSFKQSDILGHVAGYLWPLHVAV